MNWSVFFICFVDIFSQFSRLSRSGINEIEMMLMIGKFKVNISDSCDSSHKK